ncbi:hypothetical protein A9Q81_24320 [Gammaproteobacteria bacterium 42_54_T18]|nr:hypothetical protein A9Q81_24320 [Gammaproteobacteria bacterium 42_54_T18]
MHSASATPLSNLNTKEDRLNAAAILNFFGITKEWDLQAKEQIAILGAPSKSSFYRMKEFSEGKCERPSKLTKDTLERISYVMGIYKALNILLPNPRRAAEWVKKSNSASIFAGKSALETMLQGRVIDLADIRRYLDAERGL